METFDEFKKKTQTAGSSSTGLQYPDFKKTGVGTFLYGVGAGLKKGAQAVGTGINEYNKFFYNKTGLDKDYATQDYERYDQKLKEFDQKTEQKIIEKLGVDGAKSFAAQAGMGLGQAGGQLAITALNPYIGYTTIAAQAVGAGKSAYDEAYEGAKKNGMSDEQAKKIAKLNGIITGAVNVAEVIPVGRALSLGKDLLNKPLAMGAKNIAGRFVKNAALESGTEGVQDFASSLTAMLTYDKSKDPIRDGINSALVALPSSLLFGGAGEVNIQANIFKAKSSITDTLVGAGMEPEKAKLAADIIVNQHLVEGGDNIFETKPAELKEAYETAKKYKETMMEKLASDPDFKIDPRMSDTADSIIDAYNQYDEAANADINEQNAIIDEDTQAIANETLDLIPDDNFDEAEIDWTQNVEPKYKKLQKKILAEQKKRDRAIKKQQFLNEPYIPESELPTIEMGKTPKQKSNLPVIQLEPKKQNVTVPGDFTYSPIDQITDHIDSLLDQQESLVAQFREKHSKPKEKPKKKVQVEKTAPVKTETKPVEPKKTETPESVPEGKTTKVASDINKILVEKGFEELSEEEQAKYDPVTKKDQLEKVAELIENDLEKAKQMALGEEKIPSDIKSQVLFNAIKVMAIENNDIDLIRALASSPLAIERSLAAQELGASGFNNGDYNAVDIIQEINKSRKEKFKGDEKKAKNDIVKEVKTKIDAKKPKRQDWESFINEITC